MTLPDAMAVEPFRGSATEWNALLSDSQGGSFCHLYGWRDVMEGALGHETFWWAARDRKGDVKGLLPLVLVRSRLFGSYLISMPFLNYGGPVGTPAAQIMLAEHATEQAKSLGVDLLQLRTRFRLPASKLVVSERKLTVLKSLPESTEELWEKGIKAKLRSQIRRPLKEGMEVRFGSDLVEAFYDVFSTTMRDLGTPVLSRRFFEAIRASVSEASLFAVVEHEGVPVAAACGFMWRDEFEITWAGASRAHARLAPNMLLYWGLMEESVRRGVRVFNFGRCSPDSGTHKFKRQWGSEDHVLPWLQWSAKGYPSTPSPNSPNFRLATTMWRRMPVRVANVIGPPLSRLLP